MSDLSHLINNMPKGVKENEGVVKRMRELVGTKTFSGIERSNLYSIANRLGMKIVCTKVGVNKFDVRLKEDSGNVVDSIEKGSQAE